MTLRGRREVLKAVAFCARFGTPGPPRSGPGVPREPSFPFVAGDGTGRIESAGGP